MLFQSSLMPFSALGGLWLPHQFGDDFLVITIGVVLANVLEHTTYQCRADQGQAYDWEDPPLWKVLAEMFL